MSAAAAHALPDDLPLRGPAARVAARAGDDARRRLFFVHAGLVLAEPPNARVVAELETLCLHVIRRMIMELQWAGVAAWFQWCIANAVLPSRWMAESVMALFRRAFALDRPAGPARPRRPRPEPDFTRHVAAIMGRVAAQVRRHVLLEIEARAAAAAIDSRTDEDEAADSESRLAGWIEAALVATGQIERPADLPPPPGATAGATVVPLRPGMPEGP